MLNDEKLPLLTKDIVKFLRGYLKQSGMNGYVIGVSGGIDSTVTAYLCAQTGFPVKLVSLPIELSPGGTDKGRMVADSLSDYSNVEFSSVDLTEVFDSFPMPMFGDKEIESSDALEYAGANLQSRLRMCYLYYVANYYNYLVVGTGNAIEDSVAGFFTKWGDGAVDINPLGTFLKSEVYQIGHYLNLPKFVLESSPNDGLWADGRDDEDQLGLTYNEIEAIVEDGYEANVEKKKIDHLYHINAKNKHKMEPAPEFKRKSKYIYGTDPLEAFD